MQSFDETSLEATAIRILQFGIDAQHEVRALRATVYASEAEFLEDAGMLAASAVDRGVAFAAKWEQAKRAAWKEGRTVKPGEFQAVEEILAHYLKADEMRRAAA